MKKAIVLGGTAPHKDLIERLKKRDYYVFLLDFLNDSPAKEVADEHIQESTLDCERVLQIAKEKQVDLVISTCIDQANSTVCYVAEHLGLPKCYDYLTSLDLTRKGQMKKKFVEFGIPTAKHFVLEQYENIPKLQYPFVIKPTDCNSSKGVYCVSNAQEYDMRIKEAFSLSREKKVIIEEYIEGIEIQVDCIAIKGKAYILMTRDKITRNISDKELQVDGFAIPGEICCSKYEVLQEIANNIVKAFDLENTPFFYQAIVRNEQVYVLECAPRIAGGTTYSTVELYSKYDYMDSAIRCFLDENVDIPCPKHVEDFLGVRFIYSKPGVFDGVSGIEELLETGEITAYYAFVKKGKKISESANSGNRIGAVLVKGTSQEEVLKKAEIALGKIIVRMQAV